MRMSWTRSSPAWQTDPYEVQTIDGRWWLSRALSIRDADGEIRTALFIASEITERKRAKPHSRLKNSLFRLITNTSPTVIFVYDHVDHELDLCE